MPLHRTAHFLTLRPKYEKVVRILVDAGVDGKSQKDRRRVGHRYTANLGAEARRESRLVEEILDGGMVDGG